MRVGRKARPLITLLEQDRNITSSMMRNLPVGWDPVLHHPVVEELAHPVIVPLVILPDDHLVPGHDGAELLLGGAVDIARLAALCLVNMRFGL